MVEKYLLGFDELNQLIQAEFQASTLEELDFERTFQNVVDDLYECLWIAYVNGMDTVSDMLDFPLAVDDFRREEVIYQEIDGMDFTDRVYEHLSENDVSGLVSLAQSEYHRVFNTAMSDGADTASLSMNVVKTWVTVGDDKVRESHQYLEGVTIPIDEKFYTIDGDSAFYPSNFESAENNVNCRCFLEYGQERPKS